MEFHYYDFHYVSIRIYLSIGYRFIISFRFEISSKFAHAAIHPEWLHLQPFRTFENVSRACTHQVVVSCVLPEFSPPQPREFVFGKRWKLFGKRQVFYAAIRSTYASRRCVCWDEDGQIWHIASTKLSENHRRLKDMSDVCPLVLYMHQASTVCALERITRFVKIRKIFGKYWCCSECDSSAQFQFNCVLLNFRSFFRCRHQR